MHRWTILSHRLRSLGICRYAFHLRQPLFLNEVLVKMPPDPSSDEPLFHVSHIDRVYTLKTETLNERHVCKNLTFCVTTRPCFCVKHSHIFTASIRAAWVQKIKAASEHFIETEKKKREKAYQGKHSYTLINMSANIECIDFIPLQSKLVFLSSPPLLPC